MSAKHLSISLAARLHALGIDDPQKVVLNSVAFGGVHKPDPKPVHWSSVPSDHPVRKRGARPPGGF